MAAHGDCAQADALSAFCLFSWLGSILKAYEPQAHLAESYIRLVERHPAPARPDLVLSGDFIVGFPGETETDFEATLDLVRTVGYGSAYSFRYSPRPGTPAADRAQVDPAEADARLQRLQGLITEQQRATQHGMVGRTVQVLFERPGRMDGQITGKSEYLHAVHVDGPTTLLGGIAAVEILGSNSNSLAGRLRA